MLYTAHISASSQAVSSITIISLLTKRTVGKSARSRVYSQPVSTMKDPKFFSSMSSSTEKTQDSNSYFTVAITGSSGLLGNALMNELLSPQRNGILKGKPLRIVKLIRSENLVQDEHLQDSMVSSLHWNPNARNGSDAISSDALKGIDAIVHLAGENVGSGLLPGPLGYLGIQAWSGIKKRLILDSRVGPTKALANAVARSDHPTTFLVASGVGVYGNHFMATDEPFETPDENADVSRSAGFLAEVSRQWEGASQEALDDNPMNRLVNLRLAPVLSRKGGALGKLYPIFFLGGGGIVGSGNQYFSYISARDAARGIVHCIEDESIAGPVNLVAPTTATNADFTAALGKAIGRPTIIPLPTFAVKIMFGQMGEEMLLGGVKCFPKKLLDSGFQFQHPSIQEAIDSAMKEEI